MSRVPVHTVETVPPASRPFVDALLHGPGALGRLLNLQGQLAHAPVVLAAYAGIRKAVEEHATLAFTTRSAIQLTVSAIDDGQYSLAVNMMLARRAAHGGRVADATWSAALARGWGDTELAESYVYLALTRFVDEFVAYADTELDVPPEPIRT